jgi:hypothetical protein
VSNAPRKYKLSAEQRAIFDWLKSLQIDSSDDTLSYWARIYPHQRLKDIYRWTMREPRDSTGAYMQFLLKSKAIVETDIMRENKQLALDYKNGNKWDNLLISENFATCKTSKGGEREVGFSLESHVFLQRLMELHSWFEENN